MSSLNVSAHLEFGKVPVGKKKEAHLLITLEGEKYKGERKPLSLAAVIDVSGSMQGEKVEYAKRSLKKLVEHMTDQDTLAILAFSTQVFMVSEPARMTQEVKDRALIEIDKLRTLADTNLSGATLEGYQAIRKAVEKKVGTSLERVFIFTDGQPTSGDTSQEGLVKIAKDRKPENCGLTCFGYGADYNKELMTSMVKAAGGNEYHIATPDQAPGAFGREIGGLLSCVAQAVKITVKTKTDVKIKEVLNDFDVTANPEETEVVISVDDVYGSEKRKILLRLELPEMEADKATRPLKLGDIKVEFEDLVAQKAAVEETSFKVEYVKEDEADKESDKEVLEQIAVHKAAKAQEEAIKLAKSGDFTGAREVVYQAAMFCSTLDTDLGNGMAADLKNNVQPLLEAASFGVAQNYLRSNKSSYAGGRSQTVGTAGMYGTDKQKMMADSFSAPDPAPDPVQVVHNGPIPPQGASTMPHVAQRVPVYKGPSKKRNQR